MELVVGIGEFLDDFPDALPDNYQRQGLPLGLHVHKLVSGMRSKDLVDILVVGALWMWDCACRMGILAEDNRAEESASIGVSAAVHKAVGLDKVRIVMMDVGRMSLAQSAFASVEEVAGIVASEARP